MSAIVQTDNPIAIITLTNAATQTVERLRAQLPEARVYGRQNRVDECDEYFSLATDLLPRLYREGHTIIAICASGIVIRCLASVLAVKGNEPPVLSMSVDGKYCVPLIGGHRGANTLAEFLAAKLNGHAAITTAADVSFGVSLDEPNPGYVLVNPEHYPNFVSRLLAGERLDEDSDLPPVRGSIKEGLCVPDGTLQVRVSAALENNLEGTLHYAPRRFVLGVGCERGAEPEELIALIEEAMQKAGICRAAVAAVASIDLKEDERAVHAVAEWLNVPARFFTAERLAEESARMQTPSEIVNQEVGTPGVAEGAALAAVGEEGELFVPKIKSTRATCAIGMSAEPITEVTFGRARGTLYVLGLGPGAHDWRLPAVDQAINQCTDLVGYSMYIDLLGDRVRGKTLHKFALGEEELRVRAALALAAEGRHVALVCSGDPGIYAMATLVFELLERDPQPGWPRVDIQTIPGVTALQSAAARIGAPIGHDFCAISLSNLLTTWDVIEGRLHAAAQGDFVVAFYNPVSKRRDWQLPRAKEILLMHRPETTPVVIARQLGRPSEQITVTTLAQLDAADVDMLTVVLVGSSITRMISRADGGHWVYTPRGYHRKAGAEL